MLDCLFLVVWLDSLFVFSFSDLVYLVLSYCVCCLFACCGWVFTGAFDRLLIVCLCCGVYLYLVWFVCDCLMCWLLWFDFY